MEMSSKSRFPRTLWLLLVPILLLVTWLSAPRYWPIRIGRALSSLEDPATPQALVRIGSRGIPQFVDELEGALSRGDDLRAQAITRGLIHLIAGAYETQVDPQRDIEDRDQFRTREGMA